MNATFRILCGWIAVSLGIVLVILGFGLWVLLVALLFDLVLRRVVRPRIPYAGNRLSLALMLPLVIVFLLVVAASGSEVPYVRIAAWAVVGAVVLWGMYQDLRLSRRAVHESIG